MVVAGLFLRLIILTAAALYEAFGLTVIEAMTCGLPTFATNQGGWEALLLRQQHSTAHVLGPCRMCG